MILFLIIYLIVLQILTWLVIKVVEIFRSKKTQLLDKIDIHLFVVIGFTITFMYELFISKDLNWAFQPLSFFEYFSLSLKFIPTVVIGLIIAFSYIPLMMAPAFILGNFLFEQLEIENKHKTRITTTYFFISASSMAIFILFIGAYIVRYYH